MSTDPTPADDQVAAVRALAEAALATPPPSPRWLGWSVERPDGSSSFGVFRERESADRCADSVRRGLCPDAVVTEDYAQDEADTRVNARDILAALAAATPGEPRERGAGHGSVDEMEAHFIDANERMGEALVAIGMALGLPRPRTGATWGAPEILARIADLSSPDCVEAAARVLHDRRHPLGYGDTCDRCRADARAVADVLTHKETR